MANGVTMPVDFKKRIQSLLAVAMLMGLAGCGGGGGGGGVGGGGGGGAGPGGPPGGDPSLPAGSNWDNLMWDEGHWG
ncbi:MAG: hypothetical protein DIU71_00875 [Proteobacteria bacterium]|nr:MAG: hypothetical protein DIU71_00875 [Pseudomonadota bacterium]